MNPTRETQKALANALSGIPSQAELARQIGVSRATITDWSKGRKLPSLEHYLKLLDLGKRAAVILLGITAIQMTIYPTDSIAHAYESTVYYVKLLVHKILTLFSSASRPKIHQALAFLLNPLTPASA